MEDSKSQSQEPKEDLQIKPNYRCTKRTAIVFDDPKFDQLLATGLRVTQQLLLWNRSACRQRESLRRRVLKFLRRYFPIG